HHWRNGQWIATSPDNDGGGKMANRHLLERDVDLRFGVGVELGILQVGNDSDHRADNGAPWSLNGAADRVVVAKQVARRALVDDGYFIPLRVRNPATPHQTHSHHARVS